MGHSRQGHGARRQQAAVVYGIGGDPHLDQQGGGHGGLRNRRRFGGFPTDDQLRMRTDELRAQIVADRAAGLEPFLVVGTAGSVGTGATDPLPAIAKICKEFDLWFHVDGAYGAPAVALDDASADLKGLRLGRLDRHRSPQMALQLDRGGLSADAPSGGAARRVRFKPTYYQFDDNEGQEVKNYFEYGPQNTRGFRALKIWLGFQQVGRERAIAA